jgi:hemerythrin
MQLLRWQDEYLVGQESIDREHRMLFQLINEFYDAFNESRRRSDLTRLLTQLVRYAEEHFQHEEKIMVEHAYPATDDHHKFHEELYETIYQLNTRLETDPRPLDRDAIAFLKHWLVDHILLHDKKFGAFIEEAKAAASAPAQ